jgi:hypothetical protein
MGRLNERRSSKGHSKKPDVCGSDLRKKKKGEQKITIPSDLYLHPLALSVNVGNPCESPSPKPKGPRRAKPLRASATTLKFCISSTSLAGHQRKRKPENFNFNLSGSDPIVANRAGVILPYEIFLSTKKCDDDRNFL